MIKIGKARISPEKENKLKLEQELELNKYMSAEEAAQEWGVTSAWVRTLCRLKQIKCTRIRNVWFIDKDQPNPKKNKAL